MSLVFKNVKSISIKNMHDQSYVIEDDIDTVKIENNFCLTIKTNGIKSIIRPYNLDEVSDIEIESNEINKEILKS